ncbi:MAG: gamma-glutamylcyclotransferase [Actinomycetota bacterium]|nr:gamma-glutamylcyclotransferase [Actinomycetota bacterium]
MVGSVFVYGTLMPGGPLWPAMEPYAASWRPAAAAGRMWDTGRGYPAVRFLAAGNLVPGVLVDIIPGLLAEATFALDRIEEEGVLYRRVEIVTSAGPAMAYEWLGPTDAMAPLTGGWPKAGP